MLIDTACILWTGSVMSTGYGRVRGEGKRLRQLAHRVAYERAYGPIPDGYQIHHHCMVKLCVNPDHLEAMTQQENMHQPDGIAAIRAAKTHCPQGHPYSGVNLKISASNGGRECRQCKRESNRRYQARRRCS